MAKNSFERENLLRDAVQMKVRGQATLNNCKLFIGFRSLGQCSLYWNQDPVFQFNLKNELRRVYFEGMRYAAFEHKISRLSGGTTSLDSDVTRMQLAASFDEEQQNQILTCLESVRIQILSYANIRWQTVGVASEEKFHLRVVDFLQNLQNPAVIAKSPNA